MLKAGKLALNLAVLQMLSGADARKIYAGCFKLLGFDGKAITDSEKNSSSFVSDQPILDDDYTASMEPGPFELAYTASSSNANKVRMVSFKMFLQINQHELLGLEVHGDG